MNDKTVIVTGANSGMGLASSAELARQGAYVIMACRNKERGQQALEQAKRISGSDRLELAICDLQSLDSVRGFVAWFQEHYPVLDVLLNNAGMVSLKRQITPHGFEAHMGINHLGHFLLTTLLLEQLKAAEQGRIVNVSSGAYKIGRIHYEDITLERGYNVAKAYAQSKLANVLFTKELARRLASTRVTANCLHPGAVATSIGVDRATGFGKSVMAMLRPFFLTPEQGAATAIYLATSEEVTEQSGLYFYKKKPQRLSARADDPEGARKLWVWSEQQVGYKAE